MEGHMERETTKLKIGLGKVCGDNIGLSRYRDRLCLELQSNLSLIYQYWPRL